MTGAAAGSRLFGAAGASLVHVLATQNVTMNNHHYGVTPASFAANAYLPRMFALLSTNVDRAGLPFVSTMEGKGLVNVCFAHVHLHRRMQRSTCRSLARSGTPRRTSCISHTISAFLLCFFVLLFGA